MTDRQTDGKTDYYGKDNMSLQMGVDVFVPRQTSINGPSLCLTATLNCILSTGILHKESEPNSQRLAFVLIPK